MMVFRRFLRILNAWRYNRVRQEDVFVAMTAIEAYEKQLHQIARDFASSTFLRYEIHEGRQREELVHVVDFEEVIWLLPVDGMESRLIVRSHKLQKKLVKKVNRNFLIAAVSS